MNKVGTLVNIFGDSNPWGYSPNSSKYKPEECFPSLLANNLRSNNINAELNLDAMPGRALKSFDAESGITNGSSDFSKFLSGKCSKYDGDQFFVLSLSINDILVGTEPAKVVEYMDEYVTKIRDSTNKENIKTIVFIPPSLGECTNKHWLKFVTPISRDRSREYRELLKQTSQEWIDAKKIAAFLDLKDAETGKDGLHFTKAAHKLIADKLTETILNLQNK